MYTSVSLSVLYYPYKWASLSDRGLVNRIYEKAPLSVQTKDVRINFERSTNHAEGSHYRSSITRP